jgi:hypothetical protein
MMCPRRDRHADNGHAGADLPSPFRISNPRLTLLRMPSDV